MESFEDMKALAVLCEEAGDSRPVQINTIRALMGLSLPQAANLWNRLVLAGMINA